MPQQNGTKPNLDEWRTTKLGHGVVYLEPLGPDPAADTLFTDCLISTKTAMAEAAALADELWREFELHHVSTPIIRYFQEHDLENTDGNWWAGLDLSFGPDAIEHRERISHVTRRRGMISAWMDRRGSYVFYRVRITRWAVWNQDDHCCPPKPDEMWSLPTSP